MHRLNRSETFQKRFNLPADPVVPTERALSAHSRGKSRKPLKRLLRGIWWFSLVVATAVPAWAVYVTDLPTAWNQIDIAIKDTLAFPRTHKIYVPKKRGGGEPEMELGARESGFARTNADMVAWHRGMAVLQRRIADETPVGSVQDSTLEFVFHGPTLSKSPSREWRAAAVSAYFTLAASLYFLDSVHIATILFQLNLLEFSLAIMIKRLDDALEKTLEQLSGVHMELAMLPLEESDSIAIAQQQLCLQKMEIFHDYWDAINLGQNIRIPFRRDHINLNLNLVFSVVVAIMLRWFQTLNPKHSLVVQ